MAAEAPRPAVEVRDGAVIIDRAQLDPKTVALIKNTAKKLGVSFDEAMHRMLTEGAKVMTKGRPADGQHRGVAK